jgi:hypothetical protein
MGHKPKIRIYNTDTTSIKKVEEMPYEWFVLKGKLFTNWKYPLTALVVADKERGRALSKQGMIEHLEFIAHDHIIKIPLSNY